MKGFIWFIVISLVMLLAYKWVALLLVGFANILVLLGNTFHCWLWS